MCAQTVLILGNEDDEHAVHMRNYLRHGRHDVEMLDSRCFPGQLTLTYDPQRQQGTMGLPHGRTLQFAEVKSVYWRNYSGVCVPTLPDPEQSWLAHNEARALFETILIQLSARWVNGWNAYWLHQTKPVQLARIAALGVRVPPTLLTNNPAAFTNFVAQHPPSIVKPVQGGDHTLRVNRSHLTSDSLSNLCLAPVTVQSEIPGTNIRVFVIGERVLACEVRTNQLDYRSDPEAALLVHALPVAMEVMCRRIAREVHLLWTGMDFRLTPAGEYVFLEANPSPMFLGFEEQTHLPLTECLAELLTSE